MTKTIQTTKKVNNLPFNLATKLTTPQLLKASLYASWGASILVLIATISGIQGHRHAFQVVGKDAVPSILNAQRIKDSLADMDANAANELLVKPGENPKAIEGYNARREKLAKILTEAAKNITYGDAEQKPIETIVGGLGEYMQKIQQARDANQRGDTTAILAAYREAAKIMDEQLIPASDALDKVNKDELQETYTKGRFASGKSLFFVIFSGLLLIGLLVGIQLFLNQRMRRILNPMLVVASAIAVIFLGYTTQLFISASGNLKVAKEDAFESLHDLRKARAFAYIANGNESRYLLDPQFAAKHEQAFFTNVAKIATIPLGQTFETIAITAEKNEKIPGFSGLLADEFKNITFEGERDAAVATLRTFGIYFNLDQQIRNLERSGKHQEAIALCTGYNKGQSNWAFEEFKNAHQKAMDINIKAFDQKIAQGSKQTEGFEVIASIALAAIALLTLFGLLPRIKEYEL